MEQLARGHTVAHLKVVRVDGSGPQEVGASIREALMEDFPETFPPVGV